MTKEGTLLQKITGATCWRTAVVILAKYLLSCNYMWRMNEIFDPLELLMFSRLFHTQLSLQI
jgi:hypothetical protein